MNLVSYMEEYNCIDTWSTSSFRFVMDIDILRTERLRIRIPYVEDFSEVLLDCGLGGGKIVE